METKQIADAAKIEVVQFTHGLMKDIHSKCVTYGHEDGFVNDVKGANRAGHVKITDVMSATILCHHLDVLVNTRV